MEQLAVSCSCLAMNYPRAPITEAVVEMRFGRQIDRETIEKATSLIAGDFFYNEEEQIFNIAMDADVVGKPPKVKTEWLGRKLSSLERTDLVFFRQSSFVCSRLAPYMGWDNFREIMGTAWTALRKHYSQPLDVTRVGLRYVNRIDIPVQEGDSIDIDDYLNFAPRSPQAFELPMLGYVVQTQRQIDVENDLYLSLLSSAVPSPLINTASFSLDLDVYREKNIPKRDDELWSLIERMRSHKNFVFEACITESARELFR
ncbi:hypothetical protein XH89_20050 [Bradyrhizobium sp. CCBAU 53340]|uniref:TIGR04255 family protein n=1 Tax=Bradyrhizobium sp. CCBAU 53340 TaxID=1325112 RepID=UPI00188C903F|nr:TIGR04255 family protein [Bradyrhizobium sp. CCBAU 53340]QOZ45520.1 hypothetical protein XH89_20050 [Bradyrhizobium sp. CCBAU 53340]